jgi:hypothetical protein
LVLLLLEGGLAPISPIAAHLHLPPHFLLQKSTPRQSEPRATCIPATADPMAFILVRDRAKAQAFYKGVLGLTLVSEDTFADAYDLNGITLRLTTVEDWFAHPHTVAGWSVPTLRRRRRRWRTRA